MPISPTASTDRLVAKAISLGYGQGSDAVIINRNVSLTVPDRKITSLIGPNGCGKSTLLRGLARLLPLAEGTVTLDGREIQSYSRKQLAQRISMLPQSPVMPSGVSVQELVARGRHPHQSWLQQWSASHSAAVEQAMELTGVSQFRDQPLESLSGGQRQRVWIAMVLAQDTDIIFLDEPTTYLDLAHAIEVLELVTYLNQEHGKTFVMVLHDLNLATRYSDHLILMKSGALHSSGRPSEVITSPTLSEVFELDSVVIENPLDGDPLIIPRRTQGTRRATKP